MKLSISLVAASIILRFATPGPGTYYVFTIEPGCARIVACGHETNACHVSFRLPTGASMELFQTAFFPDQ